MKNKIKGKKFKALIIDCDGTLIANEMDAMPSPVVKQAIKSASKLIHIGIATQRPLFYSRAILKHLNLSGPSIISGGAQVIDSKTLKILHEEQIRKEDLLEVIKIVKEFKKKYDLKFIIQDTDGLDRDYTEVYVPNKPIEAGIFSLEHQTAEELKDKLSKIKNLSVHKVLSWEIGRFGVVITHALATKQHGIFEVAKILKINTHEIIGVGDGYNDFPLLLACGLKIAMSNAVSDLKEIADYIAPSVEDDGVAEVIRKFVL